MSTIVYTLRHLSIKDWARIKQADFDLGPTMTILCSKKNAQGKSSALNALLYAVGGAKYAPAVPVRKGAEQAEIVLTIDSPMGPIELKRVVTAAGKATAVLKNADGFKSTSPQSTIDEWLNALGSDPMAFIKADGRKRVEILKKAFGLDFTDIDLQRKTLYDKRTGQNAVVRDLKGKYEQLEEEPADTPAEEINIQSLSEKLQKATEHNSKADLLKANVKSAKDKQSTEEGQLSEQHETIAELKKKLEAAELKLKQMDDFHAKTVAAHEKAVKALADFKMIDTTELDGKIEAADKVNANVRQRDRRLKDRKAYMDAQGLAESLSEQIAAIDKKKADLIAAVKMPVAGLEIREDDVYYNDLPIEAASTGEQLRISVPISFAANARLKFTVIRDGNDLDEDNLALVCELTEAAGGQVIVERLGTGEGEGIVVFEDGELVEAKAA